ncbi:uncharacterized protein LOC144564680 isoform X2 [Carex rostrata]
MAAKRRKTQIPPPPKKETGAGKEIQVNPPPPQEEIVVTIDPRSLECSICFEPLCHPIYQCILGHVACRLCWKKIENKCSTCKKPIGGQNIALEAVLESMRLPCPNANLGCCKSLSYSQMQLHKDRCEFTQSVCPIPGCAHEAFSGQWLAHFVKDHWNHGYDYSDSSHQNYGTPCTIRFDFKDFEEDRYYTFLGPGKDVFLLVKEAIPNGCRVDLLFQARCSRNRKSFQSRSGREAKYMVLPFCYHHSFCWTDI